MVKTPRKTIRSDRLRPLNTPRQIDVVLSTDFPSATSGGVSSSTRNVSYIDSDSSKGQLVNDSDHALEMPTQSENGTPPYDVPSKLEIDGSLKRIITIREIWEIEDEWWRNHIARRYFDIVIEGGKHLIIYQNRLTGQWYAQSP